MANAHSGVAVFVKTRAHQVRDSIPGSWRDVLRPEVGWRTLVLRCPLREPRRGEDASVFRSDRDFAVAVVQLENLSDVDVAVWQRVREQLRSWGQEIDAQCRQEAQEYLLRLGQQIDAQHRAQAQGYLLRLGQQIDEQHQERTQEYLDQL